MRPTALWKPVATAAFAAIAVASIGATLTDLGPWYQSLREPSWKPPDAAFGVIWTAIFSLAAISGVLAWRADRSVRGRQRILGLFAVNGFFNLLWSLVFFKLQRPDYALVEGAFRVHDASPALVGFMVHLNTLGKAEIVTLYGAS